MQNKRDKLLIPLISILIGIIAGCIILILSGKNPVILFTAFLKGAFGTDFKLGRMFYIADFGELLVSAMPIILTGLSIAFAYRTGLFNIGAEGQVIMGSLFALLVGTQMTFLADIHPAIHLAACIFAGALGGAIWGVIPGLLKAYFNVQEVIVGIMLNYTSLYITNLVIRNLDGYINLKSPSIPATASLRAPWLTQLFGSSRMNFGFIIVILALLAFWFIIEKTSFGYSLRATGFNKEGARYAGIKVNRSIVSSMAISGALSGLAGVVITLGMLGSIQATTAFSNFGMNGIAVALVGSLSSVGIFLSGLLFALLSAVKNVLQRNSIPEEIGAIIGALIVLSVACQVFIQNYLYKIRSFLDKRKRMKHDSERGVE